MKIRFLTPNPEFKRIVLNTLNAPTSWGITVVESEPADVILGINTKREFSKRIKGRRVYFSATIFNPREPPLILFDPVNFIRGVPASGLSIERYQQYVINHEFGHAIGLLHLRCKSGQRCPVMYQMTKGVPKGSFSNSVVTKQDLACYSRKR
jgi:hypothetical protein